MNDMSEQNNHVPFKINEQIITQYLLGELPETWQAHIEELLFIDPDCCLLLQVVEERLIDDYVTGQLSGQRQKRFETRFLVSERRQQKVVFARALMQALANLGPPAPEASLQWKQIQVFWRTRPATIRYAFAGLTLSLLIGGLWLAAYEMRRIRTQRPQSELVALLSREQTNSPAPRSQPAVPETTPREPLLKPEARPTLSPKTSDSASSRLAIVIQTLKPGRFRDEEGQADEPQRRGLLSISPTTRLIRLRLELGSKTKFPAYRATLMTAEGQSVRLSKYLRLFPGSNGRIVVAELPAILPAGTDYVLTLLGVVDRRRAEELGDYYFTVLKQ